MTKPSPAAAAARAERQKRNEKIIAWYTGGLSCRAIAERVPPLTGFGVWEVLAKNGVPRRSEGGWPDDRPLSRDARRDVQAGRIVPPAHVRRARRARAGEFARALTRAEVRRIKVKLVKGATFSELGEKYGVTASSISGIAMGRTWAHVPWPNRRGYVRRPARSGSYKLTAAQVRQIRRVLVDRKSTYKAIGARYGVSRGTIKAIEQGRIWAPSQGRRVPPQVR